MYSQTKQALEDFDNQHDFERMCADILHELGYADVVPIAPRGGADGGKDITFHLNEDKRGLACVTLRKDITVKFKEDFYQRKPNEYAKYYLFSTSYISSKQKKEFEQYCNEELQADLVVQDIEALRSLLDVRLLDVKNRYLHLPSSSTDKTYDFNTEISFRSWQGYVNPGDPQKLLDFSLRSSDNKPFLIMRTFENETVGFNKAIPGRRGKIEFEYQILSSEPKEMNIAFYAIPIGKRWNGKYNEDYEIIQDDMSSLRQAYIPQQQHIADKCWHRTTLYFDFRELPDIVYTIFAPRINEGRKEQGPADVCFANIQIFT